MKEDALGCADYFSGQEPSPIHDDAPDMYSAAIRDEDPQAAVADFAAWVGSLEEVEEVWIDVTGYEVTIKTTEGRYYGYWAARRANWYLEGPTAGMMGKVTDDPPLPTAESDVLMVNVGKAVALSGFPPPPDHPEIVETIAPYLAEAGFDMSENDGRLTVEALTKLSDKDLVLLHTHGDIEQRGLLVTAGGVTTLDTCDDLRPALQVLPHVADTDVTVLPALYDVESVPMEPTFEIEGHFGTEPGPVLLQDEEVPVLDWAPDKIKIGPVTGIGADVPTGKLRVEAANGSAKPSNPALVARYLMGTVDLILSLESM